MNPCTFYQQGEDCIKGVLKSNGACNELIEEALRRRDPDPFSILAYSIQKVMGLEL